MASDDRSEDNAPAPKRQRQRRRPPVLELQATEVGDATSGEAFNKAKAEAASAPGNESGTARRPGFAALGWNDRLFPAVMAGGIGALAGAGIAAAMVLLLYRAGAAPESSLAREVASLSARIESLASRPRNDAEWNLVAERIEKLTATIGEAERRLAAIENRPRPQPSDPADSRAAAVETALKDFRGMLTDLRRMAEQAAPATTTAMVETLAGRMSALEERIASLAVSSRATAGSTLASEISALRSLEETLWSGRPFMKELATVRALLKERAASLGMLEPFAAEGLSTVAMLARQFSGLAPALLRGTEPEGNIFTRLRANATRLVEIRPIGEPGGESLGAMVARLEAKLQRGDLSGALKDAAALPAAPKTAASSWIEAATRRSEAESAIRKLIDATLSMPTTERTQP